MTKTYQKGFTLVELAIVLTIIGLLIGGILRGQQLMQNARVTATIAQVQAIESATTTFRDTYNFLPGDMPNAQNRLPNCPNCGLAVAATAGDGLVGPNNWDMAAFQSASFAGGPTAGTVNNETVLFWIHLSTAGLLSGVTMDGINSIPASYGGSLPAARIGGGFTVGFGRVGLASIPGRPIASSMAGTTVMLRSTLAAANATAGVQPVTPTIAAQMDRKMDDGLAAFGSVQAYGVAASCYNTAVAPNTAANPGYLESALGRDCGVYFRIQQ